MSFWPLSLVTRGRMHMRRLSSTVTRLAITLSVALGLASLSSGPFTTAISASPAASVAISTPELFISQPVFYHCFDSAWAITVTNADALYDVTLEEYKWSGTAWVQTWNGVVTTTDASGYAYWNHFGPD